jgi:hypothetical protein
MWIRRFLGVWRTAFATFGIASQIPVNPPALCKTPKPRATTGEIPSIPRAFYFSQLPTIELVPINARLHPQPPDLSRLQVQT